MRLLLNCTQSLEGNNFMRSMKRENTVKGPNTLESDTHIRDRAVRETLNDL